MPDHGADEPLPDRLGDISLAHHQALAERDAARLSELRGLGRRARDLRVSLEVAEQPIAYAATTPTRMDSTSTAWPPPPV